VKYKQFLLVVTVMHPTYFEPVGLSSSITNTKDITEALQYLDATR